MNLDDLQTTAYFFLFFSFFTTNDIKVNCAVKGGDLVTFRVLVKLLNAERIDLIFSCGMS